MSNRVTLYPRRIIAPGTDAPYRYDTGESFEVEQVPDVGDIVTCEGATWRVLSRAWVIPARGSYSQLHGEGPMVDLIVEAIAGPFDAEAELTDEERAEFEDDAPPGVLS